MALAAGGCTFFSGPDRTDLTVLSANGQGVLVPGAETVVYRPIDESTADIYVTDLPLERLDDPQDPLTDLSGQIVHIHVFLIPQAGRTPIDRTACNAAIRHVVLSGGAAGIYGGGGFLSLGGSIGADSLGARLRDSTLRLIRRNDAFVDRLNVTGLTGGVRALRDDEAARIIASRLERLALSLTEVAEPAGTGGDGRGQLPK